MVLPVHVRTSRVEQSGVQELAHDDGHAADLVEVGHDVLARGAEVGQVGGDAAEAVKVVDLQVDLGLVGDGEEVEDGVGGAAHGEDDHDGVLEGFLCHDVAGLDAALQHAVDGGGGLVGDALVLGVDGGHGGRAGDGHAHGLDGGGHGVGGEHAGAGALAGAGDALHGEELVLRQVALGPGADGLKHVLDVDVLAQVVAGQDSAAVDEDGGDVQAGHRHEGAGHVLVAGGDGDEAVHALAEADGLDGVGDDLAADQGRLHALCAHGDAVGDGDGAEEEGEAVGAPDAVLARRGRRGPGGRCRA